MIKRLFFISLLTLFVVSAVVNYFVAMSMRAMEYNTEHRIILILMAVQIISVIIVFISGLLSLTRFYKETRDAEKTDADDSNLEIAKIKEIDTKKGISMTGGTLKGYMQTLAVFRKDGIKKVGEIKKSLEAGNYKLYTTYVHALKSALANIGASGLSEIAKALEFAGRQKDIAFIRLNNAKFLTNLETVLNNLGNMLSSASKDEQKSFVDSELLRSELNMLSEAIESMDSAAIDKAVDSLREFAQVEGIGPSIENILQSILIGEYDEAAAMIHAFMKKDL